MSKASKRAAQQLWNVRKRHVEKQARRAERRAEEARVAMAMHLGHVERDWDKIAQKFEFYLGDRIVTDAVKKELRRNPKAKPVFKASRTTTKSIDSLLESWYA
jgi:hypothetical protein